jgi:hypothetical protein
LEEENKVLREKLMIEEAKNVELQEKMSNEVAKNAVYYGKEGLQKMLFDIFEKNTMKEIEECQSKKNNMKGNVKMALMKFFKD